MEIFGNPIDQNKQHTVTLHYLPAPRNIAEVTRRPCPSKFNCLRQLAQDSHHFLTESHPPNIAGMENPWIHRPIFFLFPSLCTDQWRAANKAQWSLPRSQDLLLKSEIIVKTYKDHLCQILVRLAHSFLHKNDHWLVLVGSILPFAVEVAWALRPSRAWQCFAPPPAVA